MIRWVIAAAMGIAVICSTAAHAATPKPSAPSASRDAAKKITWKEYQEGIKEEWRKYLARKAAAFQAYAALQNKELSKLRTGYPFYLQRLGADKAGDAAMDDEFILAAKLAYYNKVVGAAYDGYRKADKEALDQYDTATNKLFGAYNEASEEARPARKANK